MNKCVIVRGGGDIATGTIYKLVKSGFQVLVLEVEKPSAIRRNVAFCQAVYEGEFSVEDITCILVSTIEEAKESHVKESSGNDGGSKWRNDFENRTCGLSGCDSS